MIWDRSETIALAMEFCTKCKGEGQRSIRKGLPTPCNCVLRAIFRACYARFRHCVTKEKFMSRVSLVPCRGRDRRMTFARLDEEYICDFCLVSRRTLTDFEHSVFRYHFLLGADWRLCCRQLRIDRGTFFHAVYRIQQKLGRVFRELEPYSLFPLDEYFAGKVNSGKILTMPPPAELKKRPVQPPLRRTA
jgi:hypothetical protein